MNIIESFITGINEVLNHKFQSFLTMLGVIFGISAVIAMVSIGEGAQKQAIEQLRQLGTNTILINRVEPITADELFNQERLNIGLNYTQYRDLESVVPGIIASTPLRESREVVSGLNREPVSPIIIGCFPNMADTLGMEVEDGRFITAIDNDNFSTVCVLGSELARELFGFHSPIGRHIKISERYRLVCVGVLKDQVFSTLVNTVDYNKCVFVPFSLSCKSFPLRSVSDAGRKVFQNLPIQKRKILRHITTYKYPVERGPVSSIILKMKHHNDYIESRFVLSQYFKTRNAGIENFEIIIPLELIRQQQETRNLFNMIMVAIASISLLVGGIGIMNIMLATVSQRTNEIGIRRCLGATKYNIMIQFMVESLVITMSGGAFGVLLGVVLSWLISFYAEWPTLISYSAIFYAVCVSISVGLIFGLYPAWKAASTDPIKALKSE